MDGPELAKRLRENAKRLVQEQYEWGLIAQKMKNILKHYEVIFGR